MARASAGLTSAARTVVSASTVVSAATRVVFVFIVIFLVVILLDLSRNFFLDCLRNDTVNVSCVILHYAALGILSSVGLWSHRGKENGTIVLREALGNRVLQSNQLVTFWGPRRRHAPPQAPIAAWRTTAGNNNTPCSPKPTPANARTAVATMLYISIATTNPLAARLCVSSRANKQATPSASKAAPATRPRGMLAPEISAPSSSRTTTAGRAVNPTPVAASMMAVGVRKRLIMFRAKGRRQPLTACLADRLWMKG